jgi:hypothetical protein
VPEVVVAVHEVIDVDHQDARARAEQEGELGDAVEVGVQRCTVEQLRQRIERGLSRAPLAARRADP